METKIGRRLAALRLQHGLSQRELSRLSGIAATTLSEIETGKVQPSLTTLLEITAALKAPVDGLPGPKGLRRFTGRLCPINPDGRCILEETCAEPHGRTGRTQCKFTAEQMSLMKRFAEILLDEDADRQQVIGHLIDSFARHREAKEASRSS